MKEFKICGKNACWAVFNQNRDFIVKAYITKDLVDEFSKILKFLAFKKVAYKIVKNEDLEKLALTIHHEGICLVVEDHYYVDQKRLFSLLEGENCAIFLDSVTNPHNIASIVRTAANFGVKAILGKGDMPAVNSAMARVAAGGLEHVSLFKSIEVIKILGLLKKSGYKIVCSSSHYGKNLYETKLPKKCIFVLGSEANGVSRVIKDLSDIKVKIPSTENVESLNVAVSAAVLMSEYARS